MVPSAAAALLLPALAAAASSSVRIRTSGATLAHGPHAPAAVCNGNPDPSQIDAVCADFCAGHCDFVIPEELPIRTHTMSVYRETAANVTTLGEKDCGDVYGDVSFYLSNHNLAYECAVFPESDDCTSANAIEKDSQHNIFIEFQVEIDGHFGPYEMCNPMNHWDTRTWECLTYCETPPNCAPWKTEHNAIDWMGPTCFCENGRSNSTVGRVNQSTSGGPHHSNPKNWPAQCAAANLVDISAFGYCLNASQATVLKTIRNATVAECCSACGLEKACGGWVMLEGPGSTCQVLTDSEDFYHVGKSSECLAGYKFDHGIGHISPGALGGFWYSMPAEGECKEGKVPGEEGCSWRVAKEGKHVNSTCVNAGIDRVVEAHGAKCFEKCAEPSNEKTACYAACFAQTINGNDTASVAPMSKEAVVAPFLRAFESSDVAGGGCPDVRCVGTPRADRKACAPGGTERPDESTCLAGGCCFDAEHSPNCFKRV